jgi:hypothetical protein
MIYKTGNIGTVQKERGALHITKCPYGIIPFKTSRVVEETKPNGLQMACIALNFICITISIFTMLWVLLAF